MHHPLISLKPRDSKEFSSKTSFVLRLLLLASFFGLLCSFHIQTHQRSNEENDVGAPEVFEEVPVGPFGQALTLSTAQIKLANELLGEEKAKSVFSSQSNFEDFLYDDTTGFVDKITSANPEWIQFPDLMDNSGNVHPSIIANNINLSSYSGASSSQSLVDMQKGAQSPESSGKNTPTSPKTQKAVKQAATQSVNTSPRHSTSSDSEI